MLCNLWSETTPSKEIASHLKECYSGGIADEVHNPMHLKEFTKRLSSELSEVVKESSCIRRLRDEMGEPEKLWGIGRP